MTPQQIELIRQSFPMVVPIRDRAAALFYESLFSIDPSTQPLFQGDMTMQGAKLMAAIGSMVRALHQLDQVTENLRGLARRHVGYGVAEAQYKSVGTALLWTLEQGLGAEFTPELKEAWAALYEFVSGVMISAARSEGSASGAAA